jgi:UPF0042 nucleotide-binding protein
MEPLEAVVVTGLSGSGKSTALRVLEDLGYYCIDNLPVALLPRFVELWKAAREDIHRVAFGIDARERLFLGGFQQAFDEVRRSDVRLEVMYLDASDDVLVRRFSETRRPHPASPSGTVEEGIRRERDALRDLRAVADRIIDTSAFTVHELRAALRDRLARPDAPTLTVSLVSFGYKYGLPTDADLAFDCRFLPNPFFVDELRPKTGLDPAVAEYVLSCEDTPPLLGRLMDLLSFALPRYQREGKSYLTIAVGCTGGRHRSVTLVEEIRRRLAATGVQAIVRHRDVER